MDKSIERRWSGRWISAGKVMVAPGEVVYPAPYLRKTFTCADTPQNAEIYLCGLGWHELYVNGKKADDRVLAPGVTQFDRHVSFIRYDVSHLLKQGRNAVAVLLGNGLFNCSVAKWSFDKAPWRDYPKMLCDIVVDGNVIAKSDNSWGVHDSPVTYNELRHGQHYDARLEIPGFSEPDLDDSSWKRASYCTPPGGRVTLETQRPCKVTESYRPVESFQVSGWETVYDFGTNLSGWCRIKVRGKSGSTVRIMYSEKIDPVSKNINTMEISQYFNVGSFGCFQTDQYILRGDPDGEIYEPSFTYHGFRYAQVWIDDNAELLDIRAQFVHTAFDTVGTFDSSDALLNKLQRNTLQSFRSNYVGIPTDCPHREKNGWTGDAQIAAETGLWNFDMEQQFAHYLQIVVDTQRPDGQLPGIAPTGGWGFNWGNGPAWDTVLFEYPYQVYLFYGKRDLIEKYYDNFKLYLEYCESRAEDYLLDFGLGDWCHRDRRAITPVEVTSSGYYYQNVRRMVFFAELLGRKEDAYGYQKLAENIRQAFVKKFANADGSFADGAQTATAAALYFKIIDEKQAVKSVKYLVEQVRAEQHKAEFGILGAKFVPRVLAEYGYADDAFEIITQKEFPGWGWQIGKGATSLWENWNGKDSLNHIMFGDISAWMYQYPGGLCPLPDTPGFRKFIIQPCFVKKLDRVTASYKSFYGKITSQWLRSENKIICRMEIPSGCSADIILPGKVIRDVSGDIQLDVD